MISQNCLVSVPLEVYACTQNSTLNNSSFVRISNISDCTEIQEVLKLMQAKKSVEHPLTQGDNTSCGSFESSKQGDNIALLLKENIDKLVKKLQ